MIEYDNELRTKVVELVNEAFNKGEDMALEFIKSLIDKDLPKEVILETIKGLLENKKKMPKKSSDN